jgi:hypothetical protein
MGPPSSNVFVLGASPPLKALQENLVYVDSTLHPSISLLEIGRDIMPTPQVWDGSWGLSGSMGPTSRLKIIEGQSHDHTFLFQRRELGGWCGS